MFNKQKRNKRINLSQNYLYNKKLIKKLVSFASINRNTNILEIGPGDGAITRELVNTGAKLLLIEKDEKSFLKLQNRFLETENIEVVSGDVLEQKIDIKNYIVFSNPPFNITSKLIKKLVFNENSPEEMYLVLQKQAVNRFIGKLGENQMSILLKSIYDISVLHRFDRSDFTPEPNVPVVFVKFQKDIDEFIKNNLGEYIRFVQYGFQQQKPNLQKNFKKVFTDSEWGKLSKKAHFKKDAGVKDLDSRQWEILFSSYLNNEVGKKIVKSSRIKDPIFCE